ncbi:MAG TPA: type I 3-dehydroquinate dehydratase [Candidatus Aquilonibacter sp.]|nr:type I 3-dehydroquinate dehydratase [Candidatus Aquilonibacter sp.]
MYTPKVAVSIPVESKQQFVADYKRAFAQGADFVEARVDYFKGDIESIVGVMRKIAPRLIITLRPESQNGKFEGDVEVRVSTLKRLERKVEPFRTDIEHDIMENFYGNLFRRIISWHDFKETPPLSKMINRFVEMRDYGDIIKLVPTPKNAREAKRILEIYNHVEGGNLIAFGMGRHGRGTRIECVSRERGAPFTYASLGKAIAPGQFSLMEMKQLFKNMTD